jgi:hypothetical protein
MTPAPLTDGVGREPVLDGYRVVSKDEIWRGWHSGSFFRDKGANTIVAEQSTYESLRDSLAVGLQLKKESIPDKPNDGVFMYWQMLDPLGAVRSAIRSAIEQYRLEKSLLFESSSMKTLQVTDGSASTLINRVNLLVAESARNIPADELQHFEEFKLILKDNNVGEFVDKWQSRLFDTKILDAATDHIFAQTNPCEQKSDGTERRQIDSFTMVDSGHQLGICLGSQKDLSLKLNIDSEVEVGTFAAISASETETFSLPPVFLKELTNRLDSILLSKVLQDSVNIVSAR